MFVFITGASSGIGEALARQYAANGNLLKSQHCYYVSAKCGNEAAVEICRKYRITR